MPASRFWIVLGLVTAAAAPVSGQSSGASGPGDLSSAASSAVAAVKSAAKDKLLVRDLLGAKVLDPSGKTVGTVRDLAAIPGGRIVAAIVTTKDKKTGAIPVPFSALKLARSAGKLEVQLPAPVSQLKQNKEIRSLAQALPGVK